MAAVRERSIDAFETLVDGTHPAKAQFAFTSRGVIAAICQHLLDLTDKATREMNWSLANTGVTCVLFTKGRRGLRCLNNMAHFDWARRPDLRTCR
jgi:broad specificity phosphatase PhoE